MKEVKTVRNYLIASLALALGVLFGAAISARSAPLSAVAQTVVPSPTPVAPMHGMPMQGTASPMASAMPMASGMPMHGGGMMMNCPAMQTMMQHARSAADRALMMSMHQSMQSLHLTGNADHDFMVMMVPHHQMAIAMAKVELQYGKDPRVIALAKSIIAAQQKEIDEMQSWLR
jgi:hypothetical protein